MENYNDYSRKWRWRFWKLSRICIGRINVRTALIGVGGWYFLSHGGITKSETINVTTPAPAAPAPAAPSAPASDNN
jgi:hypothetical protein